MASAAVGGLVAGLVVAALAGDAARPRPPRPPPLIEGEESPLLPPPAWDGPQHVVIISEDGMRPDALVPLLAPRHIQFMLEGTTARIAETIAPSETLPSHASMLSGRPPDQHEMLWDPYLPGRGLIHVPTILSIAQDHGLSTAMFVGKRKMAHLWIGADTFEIPGHLCGSVADRSAQYFTEYAPALMFVHFTDPDDAGHGSGWMSPGYLGAVAASDRCLELLLDAIDSTEAGASTVVIVTADHGGDKRAHWNVYNEVVRRIPWIIRGPGVPAGEILEAPVSTVDTAATALAALGLPRPPEMTGIAQIQF